MLQKVLKKAYPSRLDIAMASIARPPNVGILAIEAYVPSRFVDVKDMEVAEGVAPGSYSSARGQELMSFVDDREDINSICLTAVQLLLDNYNLSPSEIGRVEVGTSSFVDKAKSTKTALLRLFPDANIEGVTSVNSFYSGTAAFLNSVAWVQSEDWDGRYALFVAADVGVYAAGTLRSTGGVAAVAVLVGPNAVLALESGVRSTHAEDAFDWYKPDLASEFPCFEDPESSGAFSRGAYLRATEDNYIRTMDKLKAKAGTSGVNTLKDEFDRVVMHIPYNTLGEIALRRLNYIDARRLLSAGEALSSKYATLKDKADSSILLDNTYSVRQYGNDDPAKQSLYGDINALLKASSGATPTDTQLYADEVASLTSTSTEYSKIIGNSFAANVWLNLLCLVETEGEALAAKRIAVISHGAGVISTFFKLVGTSPVPTAGSATKFSLDRIANRSNALKTRLGSRKAATVDKLLLAFKLRAKAFAAQGSNSITNATFNKTFPSTYGDVYTIDHSAEDAADIASGTYVLKSIGMYGERTYSRHA